MDLTDYRTLGRSGLVVSPAALGTMTFGRDGWGSEDAVSRAVFDAYVEAGGNFIDTAEVYSGGRSEELVGRFVAERSLRDRMVVATKFGWSAETANPNAGGGGGKNILRAVEGSLRRLGRDYIDLYWMHVWDLTTPAEEALQTFGDLVRQGKIRYFGLSNVPAWYATRMATLAATRGVPGPIGLQMEYSLVARGVEREHVAAAGECGMGLVAWSPLGGGFLSGKYVRGAEGAEGDGRLAGANPFSGPFTKFTDRNWGILEAVRAVAADVERPAAHVALAWAAARPGVAALLFGASRPGQLKENIAALSLALAPAQTEALDQASAAETAFFGPALGRAIFGGVAVAGWRQG